MVSKVQIPDSPKGSQVKKKQTSKTESFLEVFSKAREKKQSDKPKEKEPMKKAQSKKNLGVKKEEASSHSQVDINKASPLVSVDEGKVQPVRQEAARGDRSAGQEAQVVSISVNQGNVGIAHTGNTVNGSVLFKTVISDIQQAQTVVNAEQIQSASNQQIVQQILQETEPQMLSPQDQPLKEVAQVLRSPQITETAPLMAQAEQKMQPANTSNQPVGQSEIQVVDTGKGMTESLEESPGKENRQNYNDSRNMEASKSVLESVKGGKREEKGTLEELQQRVDTGAYMDTGRIISKNLYGNTGIQKLMDNQLQPSSLLHQVKTGIERGMQKDLQQFTIKLKPEGMGEILVRMVLAGGKISMSIGVSNIETQRLLNSEMLNLKEMLQPLNAEVSEVFHNSLGGMDMMNYQQSFYEQQQRQMQGGRHHGNRGTGEGEEIVQGMEEASERMEQYSQSGGLNAYI